MPDFVSIKYVFKVRVKIYVWTTLGRVKIVNSVHLCSPDK